MDPRLLRANKQLPARHQLVALTKGADPDVVSFGIITIRCRIERGPTERAKSLWADRSARRSATAPIVKR